MEKRKLVISFLDASDDVAVYEMSSDKGRALLALLEPYTCEESLPV